VPALNKGTNSEALYLQLMFHIRQRIMDGSLRPGAQIPTEFDLASEYQVSRGTIRQALLALVNEGLLERARGRGTFVRALPASSGVTAPTAKRIGVLLSQSSREMDLLTLMGVENAARVRGYRVSFACTEENMEQQAEDIARLQADHVAGIVIFPIRDIRSDLSIWRLQADGIPFVLVDRYFSDLDSDYVTTDNLGAGYRVTEHLIILGHTRIGFVHSYWGTQATTSVRDRQSGYVKALREYDLVFDETLIFQEPAPSTASDPFRDYLVRPDRPTAIFASTDHVAVGLMQSAQRNGLRVPDDLALVGFDNLEFTAALNPPLTTVAQTFSDIGYQAANLLMSRIEGLGGPPRHIEVPANLIVRESCGARLRVRARAAIRV
jgi:GntR family transcriptional regulator, arabinose operon transcriptional repressor